MANLLRRGVTKGAVIPATFFGMHLRDGAVDQSPRTPFHDLGYRSYRLWDSRTTWRLIEPTKGNFVWSTMDSEVDQAEALGCSIMYTMGQPPAFATGGTLGGLGLTTFTYNAKPPENIADWEDYVTAVVTRYAGRIHAYQIWNEVNFTDFWSGSFAQLDELTETAAAIIRAVDPAALIVAPDEWSFEGLYTTSMLARTSGALCDVMAVHAYVHPREPEVVISMMNVARGILRAAGLNKPIWNTEFSYRHFYENGVLHNNTDDDPLPDSLATAYIVRMMMAAWIGGAERSFFYGMDYAWSNLRLIDLADRDTLTPAATAYHHLATLLTGGHLYAFHQEAPLFRAALVASDGRTGAVFWCNDGGTSLLDLSGYSDGVDVLGNPITLSASYSVTHSPVFVFD